MPGAAGGGWGGRCPPELGRGKSRGRMPPLVSESAIWVDFYNTELMLNYSLTLSCLNVMHS